MSEEVNAGPCQRRLFTNGEGVVSAADVAAASAEARARFRAHLAAANRSPTVVPIENVICGRWGAAAAPPSPGAAASAVASSGSGTGVSRVALLRVLCELADADTQRVFAAPFDTRPLPHYTSLVPNVVDVSTIACRVLAGDYDASRFAASGAVAPASAALAALLAFEDDCTDVLGNCVLFHGLPSAVPLAAEAVRLLPVLGAAIERHCGRPPLRRFLRASGAPSSTTTTASSTSAAGFAQIAVDAAVRRARGVDSAGVFERPAAAGPSLPPLPPLSWPALLQRIAEQDAVIAESGVAGFQREVDWMFTLGMASAAGGAGFVAGEAATMGASQEGGAGAGSAGAAAHSRRVALAAMRAAWPGMCRDALRAVATKFSGATPSATVLAAGASAGWEAAFFRPREDPWSEGPGSGFPGRDRAFAVVCALQDFDNKETKGVFGAPFLSADYVTRTPTPMDLLTVKYKLTAGRYASFDEVVKDVDLLVDNCVLFNGPASPLSAVACQLPGLLDEQRRNLNL